LEGEQPQFGDLATIVFNHVLTGMILQVLVDLCNKKSLAVGIGTIKKVVIQSFWMMINEPKKLKNGETPTRRHPLRSFEVELWGPYQ